MSGADLVQLVAVTLGVVVDQEREGLAAELEWQERALCAQTDPEIFYPEKGQSTREAKRVCAACEVRPQCLDYALTIGDRYGVFGGLSERERRRMKQQAA